MKFRKKPVVVDAVQWTGDNLKEMRAFCGRHSTPNGEWENWTFNPAGTFLLDTGEATGELWVEANQAWLPIPNGEWVIRDQYGYYPCKDDSGAPFNYEPLDAFEDRERAAAIEARDRAVARIEEER